MAETDAEDRLDWVALSGALSGHVEPETLSPVTRAHYEEYVAVGHAVGVDEPSESDLAAKQFWAEVRAWEAAAGAEQE